MSESPMMQQYHEAKKLCGDALLLFRMGDFYELFQEDAKIAAQAVGLALTSRDKSKNPVPMAGFPHHQLDGYLAKLIAQGFRVAICEQVEDPKLAKGLVKREVTRVVTPGTLTDDGLLNPRENNYLAAAVYGRPLHPKGIQTVGLAWVELSTGYFAASTISQERLADELARISPSEFLVVDEDPVALPAMDDRVLLTKRPAWSFHGAHALEVLNRHFGTRNLEGFGFESDDDAGIRAAGAILEYLHETQKSSLAHIERLLPYRPGSSLEIDQATRRSLELTRTMRDGRRDGSLLAVLDRTVTSMGSRLLGDWLSTPLTDRTAIVDRLDAIEELIYERQLAHDIRDELRDVYDMQRLLTRVTTGRATPRDLQFIGRTLTRLPSIKSRLEGRRSRLLAKQESQIDLCPDLRERLESALVDNCPLASREGGLIRPGFHDSLDELRRLATGGKQWIAQYQAIEQTRTGISSLKVGFNKVFGFYLEITNVHRDKVPSEYLRKQTLKNAERYITPELKEYEEKVLTAEDKAKEIEYELFVELRQMVEAAAGPLRVTAGILAALDVLVGMAELAESRGYCRPELTEDSRLEIVDGRHPVLDILEPEGTFIPNDASADESRFIMLITGPNMAGKSTYIRQVALITLMAQMGSYVPAKQATIGIADRIYARVGASDELARGQSTFMVEMVETARILNTASHRSLVILDEIGRGTSTYDGVSLAWSIVEHIHDQIGCRTLFATHYHELTQLSESHPGVVNLNVSVQEWQGKVVFLHKIVEGSADKSYGIHVAQLAGVPPGVTKRANDILAQLESQHLDTKTGKTRRRTISPRRPTEFQLTLFETHDHPVVEAIRNFRLDAAEPQEALRQIRKWQQEIAD